MERATKQSAMFRDPLKKDHRELLRKYVSFAIDRDAELVAEACERLRGGIENRNYKVTAMVEDEKRSFVLRCPPEEIPEWRKVTDPGDPGDSYDLGREYRILKELEAFSIGTPKAWGHDIEGKFFGVPSFLMEFLPGESLYSRLFPSCDVSLLKRFARRIADITGLPYRSSEWLQEDLPKWPLERTLEWSRWRAREHLGDPLAQFALSWLKERQPDPKEYVFCHGDANPTNFLVRGGRITGIVDWEFACLKDDPLDELSFFCWLYDGELLRRGLGDYFCDALGRNTDELQWFFARGWFEAVFGSEELNSEVLAGRRRNLARAVGRKE